LIGGISPVIASEAKIPWGWIAADSGDRLRLLHHSTWR
jgi:hypothetical protein